MYTNLISHGGDFRHILDMEFANATDVSIASGYTSLDILHAYEGAFLKIASQGGVSKLLLGMAFYEGLGQKKLETVLQMNEKLSKFNNGSGVYVTNGRRYHGKVYHFKNDDLSNVYVGSSNFSSSGTRGNIECTIPVESIDQKQSLLSFLDDLYSPEYSIPIDRAEITVPNKKKIIQKSIENYWSSLKTYNPKDIEKSILPKFIFPLSRVAEKEKSNLNVYFGKGRLNTKTRKITPRPWYEIELIASNDLNSQVNYPKGDFLAYTDDGLIIPMRTQGDYHKNIRSKESLQIFGIWLKGKLERSGALQKYEPVNLDVLEEYGNDKLTFYKIDEGRYYMEF
jgi:hypothetical protein